LKGDPGKGRQLQGDLGFIGLQTKGGKIKERGEEKNLVRGRIYLLGGPDKECSGGERKQEKKRIPYFRQGGVSGTIQRGSEST